MKLPERNDRYLVSTMTLVGIVLLIAIIWGPLSPWWLLVAIPVLLMGHGQEYADLRWLNVTRK